MISRFLCLLLAATLIGCQDSPSDTTPPANQTTQSDNLVEVDLVFTNGKIITVDSNFSVQNTLIVNDGLIVESGGAELLEKYRPAKTVDLAGKTLMPGFVDSHTHIRGQPKRFINLSGVSSIADMQKRVEQKASELGQDEWITGYGWSEDELSEGRKPLRQDLDNAAPNNPVILTRAGGHSAVVNSLALKLAEITDETPNPEGGVIERDEQGVANGIIRERHYIVGGLVPEPTYDELITSLETNLTELFSKGITSITDASKRPSEYAMWQELYAKQSAALPRASLQFQWHDPEAIKALKAKVGDGNAFLKIGPIKVFVDGGFTGPAAYTKEPYRDQGDYRGHLNMSEADLVKLLNEVHDDGWQMGIHAIGDAAIELVVEILADTLTRNPRADHRHYLNHFSMRPSDATLKTMAKHNIHITQQPNFTYTLEGRYVANLDGWRLEHNNPLRSPMEHGITVAISSDILPIGPMVGIYAAVTRKGMSGRVFAPEEAITMEEAIRGYTLTGAYLGFEEDRKGSLEAGKFADMIVLSDDLLTVEPAQIMDVQVEQTWLGGKLVYQK
ncbi:MAG: amidohydrolase [Pseudomonadota bacterium]